MNIVIVGFMGAGKTTLGRKLACKLGYAFFDTDAFIIAEQKMNVSQIFKLKGEPYFRELETNLLNRFINLNNSVIAIGGGTLITEGNWDLIHKIGVSIFIKADLNDIFERVTRNDKRPLLQTENPRKLIEDLYSKRKELYYQADIIIETHEIPIQKSVSNLIGKICDWINHQ